MSPVYENDVRTQSVCKPSINISITIKDDYFYTLDILTTSLQN
jgi:hypothetical protein